MAQGFTLRDHRFGRATGEPANALNRGGALCDAESRVKRLDKLDALNQIISDDEQLENSFQNYSKAQAQQYMRYLEPVRSRLLFAAQNRGLAPSLLTRRKKRLLLNVIRCEAHRDLTIEALERDVGSTKERWC